jgi:hypothetical protein
VVWEDGGGNPASYPVGNKTYAFEPKVQTDDIEKPAFRSVIRIERASAVFSPASSGTRRGDLAL